MARAIIQPVRVHSISQPDYLVEIEAVAFLPFLVEAQSRSEFASAQTG